MPSANRTSPEKALDLQPSQTKETPPITHSSICMKGNTRYTPKQIKRARRRTSKKKKNKMLPSRVARLLGSIPEGTGNKLSKSIAGADDQLCVLARRAGPKTALCNTDIGRRGVIATDSANCFLKCGTSLCNGTGSVMTRGHSSLSDSKEDLPSSSGSTSGRTDRCVAIDCEMVGTAYGGTTNALGRCSIVNYDGEVLYDKYIKPDLPIMDYRTRWSGITAAHMENAVPFHQAKPTIQTMLKGKIVIGHDVQNDFRVLCFGHPHEDIRDTSRYRGLRFLAGEDGKKRSVGLKAMVGRLLGKTIQFGSHCSVEDARATMSLYRLVDKQWEEDANSLYPDQHFRSSLLDDHFWPDNL